MASVSFDRLEAFLEEFAEVNAAVDYVIAERLMSFDGDLVVDPGVGGHLGAALFASPIFGCASESSANSLLARCFVDEPALDETDWMRGIAAVGVGAEAGLKEAGEIGAFAPGDEDCHWESAVSSCSQDRVDFSAMLFY